jgi:hypothetical protein
LKFCSTGIFFVPLPLIVSGGFVLAATFEAGADDPVGGERGEYIFRHLALSIFSLSAPSA